MHIVLKFNSVIVGSNINVCVAGGDVPPKKLQALQKVLQSEFCNAIREVHVHIQEYLSGLNENNIV